jgi:hypothetical protein
VGSNPCTIYWMDVSDASYYIQENNEIKLAEWGTPKKNVKKKMFIRRSKLNQNALTNFSGD